MHPVSQFIYIDMETTLNRVARRVLALRGRTIPEARIDKELQGESRLSAVYGTCLIYIQVIRDLELLPRLLGQDWSGVFTQRFEGSVTIWPRTRLRVCLYICLHRLCVRY